MLLVFAADVFCFSSYSFLPPVLVARGHTSGDVSNAFGVYSISSVGAPGHMCRLWALQGNR
jgi:hypothetical protein